MKLVRFGRFFTILPFRKKKKRHREEGGLNSEACDNNRARSTVIIGSVFKHRF